MHTILKHGLRWSVAVLVLAPPSLHAGQFVHETASEYTATPDLDANGFADVLIIDKTTGLYRVAYGSASASVFTLSEGRPSGVSNVTGLAVDKLNGTTADSFAVTSPAQNRANILSPLSTGYTEPKAVLDAGLGPQVIAALDIPGGASPTAEDDLAVIASLNLVNQTEVRQIRSNAGAWSLLRADNIADFTVSGGNPIIPHAGSPALFAFMRDDGATSSFHAYDLTGASATEVLSAAGLSDGSRFICSIFAGANADVMSWVPGQSTVTVGRISAAAPWSFVASNNYNLGQSIAQLVPVNGPSGTGVLIRYDSGAVELRAYTLVTGFSAPLSITPTGTSGFLSGVVPMPGHAFQLLYSATPGGPTSSLVTFENSGSGWTQTGITNLPALKPLNQFTNVLLLEQPLFRGDTFGVLRTYQTRDWTTGASESGGGPYTITANSASFGGSTQGIGASSPQNLGTVTNSPGGAAVNQMHPQFSLFTFSSNLGPAVDAVTISPPSGTYAVAQQITFSGLLPATTVYYRINGSGAFQVWDLEIPPWITRASTVEFYTSRSNGNSAVQTAHYDFSNPPAMQDSDGDGVPDFVEIAHSMDPAGGDDWDRDGFGDLDELAASTNPNDAGDFPASEAPALDSMLVDARMRLQALDGTITANAEAGTAFEMRDPFGARLGGGVIGTGAANPLFGRANARGVNPRMAFITVRSAQNFSATPAGTNEPRGHELAAIIPALEPESWSWSTTDGAPGVGTAWGFGGVNWQPGSTNWNAGSGGRQGADANWSQRQLDPQWDSSASGTYSAAGWIAELQAAMNRGAQPYAEVTLTPATSLAAVIFAQLLAQTYEPRLFGQTLNGADLELENLTSDDLWRLRRPDVEFPNLSAARVIALLRQVDEGVHGSDLGAQALRKLARDIYLQHQALAPDHLGDMPTPLAAFAEMVEWYSVPYQYYIGSSLTNEEINVALQKMVDLLANPPARSSSIQFLFVRSTPNPPGLSLLETGSGSPRLLLDGNLNPLSLPTLAEAPAGTMIRVVGYQDMPQIGGYTPIEVLSISLQSLPLNVGEDTDGDLLADAWELRHFGTLDLDGYANQDGSLYTLMQEYFDGTDPNSSASSPPVTPVAMEFFDFQIMNFDPPSLQVRWPNRYASAIRAYFQQSTDLEDWSSLPLLPAFGEGGFYFRSVPIDAPRKFFLPKAELRR
jgi:hypothetical protein